MTRTFTSRPEYYHKDREKAAGITITPARLTRPDGTTEPAIALLSDRRIIAVLPTDHAYRIATAIADHLTTIRKEHA